MGLSGICGAGSCKLVGGIARSLMRAEVSGAGWGRSQVIFGARGTGGGPWRGLRIKAMSTPKKRILIGLTGASGICYGIRSLELLAGLDNVETHLIVTSAARRTLNLETDRTIEDVQELADVVYPIRDIAAGPASGSFATSGMLVAPCSIRSLSAIANSHSSDLLTRAADVTLKERRPLVLMVRETPLHRGHLRLMDQVVEMGGIIFPPVPAFYTKPMTLESVVSHTSARAIAQLGIDIPEINRWTGPPESNVQI